jgi:hypothetical protein
MKVRGVEALRVVEALALPGVASAHSMQCDRDQGTGIRRQSDSRPPSPGSSQRLTNGFHRIPVAGGYFCGVSAPSATTVVRTLSPAIAGVLPYGFIASYPYVIIASGPRLAALLAAIRYCHLFASLRYFIAASLLCSCLRV